jgi:hypothetical protein
MQDEMHLLLVGQICSAFTSDKLWHTLYAGSRFWILFRERPVEAGVFGLERLSLADALEQIADMGC